MPEFIVYFLESVEVEYDQGELVVVADRPVQFFFKILLEEAPVIESR
jgi:hypothetical protein